MKYTGPVYRPPFEADSLLIQVTAGCSHNRCSFCTMYKDVPFQTEEMEQIENDIREAVILRPHAKRIFLVNGDPFVLSFGKLKAIAEKINEILPGVETIAMYASINNISSKTDWELRELRRLKINDLNIGVESGMQEVVEHFNKGFTVDEAKMQLRRLSDAGIDFSANIIIGAAGGENFRSNAASNISFLNEIKPKLIFVAALHVDPGSQLEAECERGVFRESTLREYIEEQIEMLSGLELENSYFFGLHTSNPIKVHGMLPARKQVMVETLKRGLESISPEYLDAHPERGLEGAINLKFRKD